MPIGKSAPTLLKFWFLFAVVARAVAAFVVVAVVVVRDLAVVAVSARVLFSFLSEFRFRV